MNDYYFTNKMDLIILLLFLNQFISNILTYDIKEFSIKLFYDIKKEGNYSRQTKLEDEFLYLIGSESNEDSNNKYIIKYDIETCSIVEMKKYYTKGDLCGGELMAINSNTLYLSSIYKHSPSATCQLIDLNGNTKEFLFGMYGYRRFSKKVGSYYYQAYRDIKSQGYLVIEKMTFVNNNNDIFKVITKNEDIQVRTGGGMISCDFTGDDKYVACAYYDRNDNVSISVYNNNLSHIVTKKFENGNYYDSDNYIKIVYLRDFYNFVLMNIHDAETIAFRYLEFNNNIIRNRLQTVFGVNYFYSKNNFHKHNGENDIIPVDSDKIVYLHTNNTGKDIYIIIYQFHEGDSILTVKKYHMFNNKGFKDLWQSRINMIKNSFAVTLSAEINKVRKPGYFFINFPNSTDITVTNINNIKIQNIISLENKLFDVVLKFKVLSIPDYLIFNNTLTDSEIKVNEEIEKNAELKLIQYRINHGKSILEFEAIARGYDSGYYSCNTIPNNKFFKDNEVYLEGRHGKITIDINGCLDGFYHMEDDLDICTNIKPENYYIDEETKTYRKCESPCYECSSRKISDEKMNCISCISGYYMTENYSCYKEDINNYFLYNNILIRCHPNCSKCTSRENFYCLECQKGYYLTEFNNSCYRNDVYKYYLDIKYNKLRRCHENCLQCESIYNSDCISCEEGFYLTEDTRSCYEIGIYNYYFDEKTYILRKCHENCLKCINETNIGCLICKPGYYLTEDTKSCYENGIDYYYLDNITLRRCHENCKQCYNSSNYKCKSCKDNFYLTKDTNSCYENGTDRYYLDEKLKILIPCYERCLKCFEPSNAKNMNCLECIDKNKYYYREDLKVCLLPSEYERRNYYFMKLEKNISFYLIISIFIISIIILICCYIFKKRKKKENNGYEKTNNENEALNKNNNLNKNKNNKNAKIDNDDINNKDEESENNAFMEMNIIN